jgi:hypothetical protein
MLLPSGRDHSLLLDLALASAPEAFDLPEDAADEDRLWVWAREGYWRQREVELVRWGVEVPASLCGGTVTPETLNAAAQADFGLTAPPSLDEALRLFSVAGYLACVEERQSERSA